MTPRSRLSRKSFSRTSPCCECAAGGAGPPPSCREDWHMEVFSRALDALGKAGALVGKRKGGLGTGCEACVLETSCGALWYLPETDRRRCWGWHQGLSCPLCPGSCLSPSLDLCKLPWERDAAPSGGRRLKATCAHPLLPAAGWGRPGDRCHGRWGLRGSCLSRKERAHYQAIFVGG